MRREVIGKLMSERGLDRGQSDLLFLLLAILSLALVVLGMYFITVTFRSSLWPT